MFQDAFGRSMVSMPFLSSWLRFWGVILIQGSIAAALMWLVRGWWFKIRIRWSGDPSPDATVARRVYGWANVVAAVPLLAKTLLDSFRHADPASAMRSPSADAWSLIAVSFWSVWVGYRGVRAVFPATRTGPALFWFAILPGGFLAAILGAVLLPSFVG
jgi:hypothetical protein